MVIKPAKLDPSVIPEHLFTPVSHTSIHNELAQSSTAIMSISTVVQHDNLSYISREVKYTRLY